ncbi:hypothetical protein MIND_00250000 [Mycena indigotica]|uniref:P-loop containing nucleoside triphosphate hydrolase protein n=1 Tax=Mycena indigotica TaxID=2126181 RepID=A0A8H6T8M4_9AGAR|nr:uncharacterized protein MIND_00250000 [Mycena indigotica]KAF7312367.1 hypothetical protein MIND_00250000 [Mycena indigotica]
MQSDSSSEPTTPDSAGDGRLVGLFEDRTITTRGYQQELLDESLKGNTIIAMPTGSGKTHIAVLRMKAAVDREPMKVAWFLAPTVSLCHQQKEVIQTALPVSVGLISGANEPEHWKDANLWTRVLSTNRIVVSTPQVLLDALRHSYVSMGRDLSLIVFDEAHHTGKDHPYNRIMREFYFTCPARDPDLLHITLATRENVRPAILGLTASPIYGGDVEKSFKMIENNLDSKIRAPLRERAELDQHVHKPVFIHVMYDPDESPFSTNLDSFQNVFKALDIDDDPYVKKLRRDLEKTTYRSNKWQRIDQRLSRVIAKKDTYIQTQLRSVLGTAEALCSDIGPWAADWLIYHTVTRARAALDTGKYQLVLTDLPNLEKAYMLEVLNRICAIEPSYYGEDIVGDCSDKVAALVKAIKREKEQTEADGQTWNALVFVQRREAVLALAEVLAHHPDTKDIVKVGELVGTTDTGYKSAAFDLTKALLKTHASTLQNFKTGEKNLIISTAVAEEGIDIQACGSVIRWDPAPNMASWMQSRGRARRQKSTFTLLVARDQDQQEALRKWEKMEAEMIAQYSDPSRQMQPALEDDDDEYSLEDRELVFRVESTGALLTLSSAIPHLNQFCALIPHWNQNDYQPIYELDPPEHPEGWHALADRRTAIQYKGPWGAKVTLPRILGPELRSFETERVYPSKASACRHVAFVAYKALYEKGLLNQHLLPLTSVVEPHLDEEVKELLKDVEKRHGTATVSVQINPWAGETDTADEPEWFASKLTITGLPALYMYTQTPPVALAGPDAPILHRKEGQHAVTWCPLDAPVDAATLAKAREYTRRVFWTLNGSRMVWDDVDFCYLFLPVDGDDVWVDRRAWHVEWQQQNTYGGHPLLCNASAFAEKYSYAKDITLMRKMYQFGSPFRFVRWRKKELTDEEEAEIRAFYKDDELDIEYPLLVAQPLPPRTNFLVPLPAEAVTDSVVKTVNLLPERTQIVMCSAADVEYATLLPSVLRALGIAATIGTMQRTMLAGTELVDIPRELLTTALCAPVAGELSDYERLETLGDTVLKYMVSLQLLGQFPLWHEGYLTKKMGHTVSNARLAKANIGHEMYRFIIRDRLLGKKWKPRYMRAEVQPEAPPPPPPVEEKLQEDDKKKKKKKKSNANNQELSTKVLADVVEALIGAAYLHGSFDLAVRCGEFFGLNITWAPLPERVDAMFARVEPLEELPSQLDCVERMLGYTFRKKPLLVEALTHCSYQSETRAMSYERLEFCGDAVLDMIVTDFLYRSHRKYQPGQIMRRKSTIVNAHTLAYICLRTATQLAPSVIPQPDKNTPHRAREFFAEEEQRTVYLYQCMLHSSDHVLSEQAATAARCDAARAEIEAGLTADPVFPWAPLFLLQAPKFLSDLVESVIGAVFIDSAGDLGVVEQLLRRLGLMQVLERVVADDVDVLHPVSRLHEWASARHAKVDCEYVQTDDRISCVVTIDGEPKPETRAESWYAGKMSKHEVKLAASHKANKVCKDWVIEDAESRKRKREESDVEELAVVEEVIEAPMEDDDNEEYMDRELTEEDMDAMDWVG